MVGSNQCIQFQTAAPLIDHWLGKTELLKTIEHDLLEYITYILSSFLSDTQARIVAMIVYGIVTVPFDIVTDIVQLMHGHDAPSITPMAENAVATVRWAQSSGFKLTTAALNGSLQLCGELTP